MPKESKTVLDKQSELKKYRDLDLAAADYYIEAIKSDRNPASINVIPSMVNHFSNTKIQIEEDFRKGRLTKLKQHFRFFTEALLEQRDLNFTAYLKKKTNYNIDIFKSYLDRVEKIIIQGKIRTHAQYKEIMSMVDQLVQETPVNHERIELLNKLLINYHERQVKKQKSLT